MTGGEGGHTVVPQYSDHIGYTYHAPISGKRRTDTLGPIAQKVSPDAHPPDFLQQELEYIGLLEYGSKFGENCAPLKKQPSKSSG
jgi:hypothetical protein